MALVIPVYCAELLLTHKPTGYLVVWPHESYWPITPIDVVGDVWARYRKERKEPTAVVKCPIGSELWDSGADGLRLRCFLSKERGIDPLSALNWARAQMHGFSVVDGAAHA